MTGIAGWHEFEISPLNGGVIKYMRFMKYTTPHYASAEVDQAGVDLVSGITTPKEDIAFGIVENFRSSHNFPISTIKLWFKNVVQENTPRIDKRGIICISDSSSFDITRAALTTGSG